MVMGNMLDVIPDDSAMPEVMLNVYPIILVT